MTAGSLLEAAFTPTSVALIGASDNPGKLITYRPIEYLLRYGYAGGIYPVNPKYQTVQGLPAYRCVADLPESPDTVIAALPRQHIVGALEECAAHGARLAIVYSSGFAEVPDGASFQSELTQLSQRTGMRVIGPNCQGIANIGSGYFPCFSTAFATDATFATDAPPSGRAAVISQSGAVAGMIYNRWTAVGGGAKYWASTGNEADVTVAQLAAAVIEDPDVDQVLLYLESIRDGEVLGAVARRAAELGKHIVAYRSASTARGWLAASRHTSAGTADDDKLEASLPQGTHFHAANSLDELIGIAQLARTAKVPAGPKLAIISNSGGLGVMAADTATRAGFTLDELGDESTRTLSAVLPGFASVLNPIDVTAQLLNDRALLAKALPPLLADSQVDATLVALGAVGDGYDIDQIERDVQHAQQTSDKPVVVVWEGSRVDVRQRFGTLGVPIFTSLPQAVAALGRFRADAEPGSASDSAGKSESAVRPGPAKPTFADLFSGARYVSGSVSIPASALDHYAEAAEQSGDLSNVHVSAAAARAAGHPRRLVSGLHTLTYVTILGEQLGLWQHASVMAGFNGVRFTRPLYEGDSVLLEMTVSALKPLRSRPGSGLVSFAFRLGRPAAGGLDPVATGTVDYVFGAGDQ
jgi:acyl-CoA synthetase (NDP forming)